MGTFIVPACGDGLASRTGGHERGSAFATGEEPGDKQGAPLAAVQKRLKIARVLGRVRTCCCYSLPDRAAVSRLRHPVFQRLSCAAAPC